MKRKLILLALAAVAMFPACQKNETERQKLDGRTVSPLSVEYALNGQAVQTLSFTKEYSRPVVQVNVSDAGLRWDLQSDKTWCKVLPATHKGPGPVTLEIEANDSFDKRDAATLTFTAGDFQGFRITVEQSGSSFIISQPYFISKPAGNIFTVEVTTLEDLDWDVDVDDWIGVNRQAPVPDAVPGRVKTTLDLVVGADDDDSRMGQLTLISGNDTDAIRIWQFGTEWEMQGEDILLPYDDAASFSIVAPRSQIRSVDKPDFATQSTVQLDEFLDRLTFSLTENFSDLNEPRAVPVSLTLANNTVVSLPSIKQKYLPAGGLMTAGGMLAFAARVAAGESTEDWEKEGWVTVLQDIDMTGVANWPGVGTSDHPFSGKFDGANHAITKLTNSPNGIFNYCKGESAENVAKVKNLVLAEGCSFKYTESGWTGNAYFGGIVNRADNTEITGCISHASFNLGGSSGDDSPAWFGCILGMGGVGTSVSKCEMASDGTLTLTSTGSDAAAYVGGIAGEVLSISDCKMYGTMEVKAALNDIYIGGITSSIASGSTLNKNTFGGVLTINDTGTQEVYLGGLYAYAQNGCNHSFDQADDKSVVAGTIRLENYKNNADTRIFAGGFLGYALPNTTLSFKDYELNPKIQLIQPADDKKVSYFCFGGVLGGCNPDEKVTSLSFDGITSSGGIAFKYNSKAWSITKGCYGGIAGFINGQVDFVDCTNEGAIGARLTGSADNPGRSQGSSNRMGGLVGYAEGGNASFTSCHNKEYVYNAFYSNYPFARVSDDNYYFNSKLNGMFCGGLLGAFDFNTSVGEGKLTITNCDNPACVDGVRGVVGGIVGYCQNAIISSCTHVGPDNSEGPEYLVNKKDQVGFQQGGIVGTMRKGSISDCTVKWFIHAGAPGSSEFASSGGILGRAYSGDAVTISGCKFYGTIQTTPPSTAKELYPGGIVGYGMSNTVVSDCRYGGRLVKTDNAKTSETWAQEITSDEIAATKEYVFGNGTGTISGEIKYWMGNN